MPRYFPNTTSIFCELCPFDCYTCSMSRTCLSCNASTDFRQLNSTTGRCDPQKGYLESSVTVAEACFSNCSACSFGYFLRNDSMCYGYCLLGTFPNNSTQNCDACPSNCLSCDSLTFCTSCISGFFIRTDNLCHSTCPSRFFGNPLTTRC